MNDDLRNLLIEFNFNECEINDLVAVAPMLEVITCKEFLENCKVLTDFGYPEEDLDVLIASNPNIFTRLKSDLEKDLTLLAKNNPNIEETLKLNPYII